MLSWFISLSTSQDWMCLSRTRQPDNLFPKVMSNAGKKALKWMEPTFQVRELTTNNLVHNLIFNRSIYHSNRWHLVLFRDSNDWQQYSHSDSAIARLHDLGPSLQRKWLSNGRSSKSTSMGQLSISEHLGPGCDSIGERFSSLELWSDTVSDVSIPRTTVLL